MTRLIAVTGATGALGGRVARRVAAGLADADARLRLVVRDAGRAPSLPGAEMAAFPGGYPDPVGFARHTFLRHSMYADFVPFFAVVEGDRVVIAAPGGQGRTSFVSRDDLADVGAAVPLDDSGRFDGRALDVTGPSALTLGEAADVLAELTGRPAEYRDQTVEEAWATRRPSGHPDWEIEGWVTSYLAIREGELPTVSDVVAQVTGHPPLAVAEHLRRHPEDWARLAR